MSEKKLWNHRLLSGPPLKTYPDSKNTLKDIEEIKNILDKAVLLYKNQPGLWRASALCSKLIYQKQNQFRTLAGFQWLKKTNTALLRFNSMKIHLIIENFTNSITYDKIQNNFQLPTRETFDYLLVRLQGLAKILCRIVVCAKTACEHFLHILKLSFFVEFTTLLLAVLGEIWSFCRVICKETVKFYNSIKPFQTKLKCSKNISLNQSLPKDLGEWIGDDWIYEINNIVTYKPPIKKHYVLLSNEMNESAQSTTNNNNASTSVTHLNDAVVSSNSIIIDKIDNTETKLNKFFKLSVEIGEEINRNKIDITINNSIPKIKNKGAIYKFIKIEDKKRLSCKNHKIRESVWNHFKTKIFKEMKKNNNEKELLSFCNHEINTLFNK